MLPEFRTFASVVGRRTALRYGALGVLAALTAACSGKEAAGGAEGGVARLALDVFAKGTWDVSVVLTGGTLAQPKVDAGRLTVDAGRFTADPGLLGKTKTRGEYALSAGQVRVHGIEYWDEPTQTWLATYGEPFTGSGLPADVPASASADVQWSMGTAQQVLPATWDGRTLRCTGHDFHGKAVAVTATRA
ncbi:hypothetical protein KZZ52_37455 [Dactylosporangium sp. AC04546]|uniref:hypothetical protein n=1 Tax=Dactylosporangium sp. AC04546 TaxID=2862460 RepID=UPI002E7BBC7C|nr:hypothetical protein [Dactylosporangium sp. AC04546]WVK79652.1 hypothetical protein KZZ52_37455 [Dactylosporangium sp. AC04546]